MKRSKHSLSNYSLATCDMGQLIPVGLQEILPGDVIQANTNAVIRMSPMAAPVMHPITIRLHHFFCPNRILWDGWEDFITGGPDGLDASTIPTIELQDFGGAVPLLADYFGINVKAGMSVNKLPFLAYAKIWNHYFRDQDLMPEADLTNDAVLQVIRQIAWEKDAFASARPWEQKGEAVTLPLGTEAPVKGIGRINQTYGSSAPTVYESGNSAASSFAKAVQTNNADTMYREDPDNPGFPGIYADLTDASSATVNDLRRAFALQRFAEARARYGSRYSEYLRYLGITPSDARLQDPEYLGGGRSNVSISEVLQTAPENADSSGVYGVGDMYGHGIGAMSTNKFRRYFEEHGYMLTLMSVRPKAMYTNGADRHFFKQDREDYWQKELQHLGSQPVLKGELFTDATDATNRETFGFNDRYYEYRTARSHVCGEFRNLLDYWHLGRKFETAPTLNNSFVECRPSKRIFNEQTQHSLWCAVQNKVVARRLIAQDGTPRIF